MPEKSPSSALSKADRVHAQHWLRGVDDNVLGLVRALSPDSGMAVVTVAQFDAAIDSLIGNLRKVRQRFGSGKEAAKIG